MSFPNHKITTLLAVKVYYSHLSFTIKRAPNITKTVLLKIANTSNLSYLKTQKINQKTLVILV